MHMQDGIGRQGYRVLAWMFAGLGLLGLGASIYAFQPGGGLWNWLGFALAFVAVLALVVVNMIVLQRARAAAEPATPEPEPASVPEVALPVPAAKATAPAPAPAPAPRPRPPHPRSTSETPTGPEVMVRLTPPVERKPQPTAAAAARKEAEGGRDGSADGIEYEDAEPAARAAPTRLVLPDAFRGETPAGQDQSGAPAWPERKAPSGRRLGEMADRAAKQLAEAPRTAMAKIWYPKTTMPRGWKKGQCGDCGTHLMSPPERPVNLRCPHCDKVTLLQTA